MPSPGIILLNGSSRSGKSTLARARQRRLEPHPVLTALDGFVFGQLPPSWHDKLSAFERPRHER